MNFTMKKILLFVMGVLGIVSFSSCSDDSDGLTDIVYYPHLTVTGDEFYINPIGQPFVDPGCTATYMGEDYTSHVVATGVEDIDVNKAGLYYVTYTATSPAYEKHPQGYSLSARRTVAVCDPSITTDLSGAWTGQNGTYRIYHNDDGSDTQTNYDGYSISFTRMAPGIFYVTDMLDGYYDQRAGYGSSYALSGYMQLLSDGSLKFLSGSVPGWSTYTVSAFDNAHYDAATGTISYHLTFAGMDFYVVLTK